ncbi:MULTISPECIES: YdcF family protein [Trichocoleus]|uniref:YdcF family protein n=1 Tax=Trichocoleus desertorum GB2-A4 TaxID=2933944 RepID=A0ABV0J7F9_9CYAN|nr:YdcF family protein [Trichocoleus sp. FACHB-46]MBD1862685.1 YdcF family protein [Trichocoleus sp. FACHB-46]
MKPKSKRHRTSYHQAWPYKLWDHPLKIGLWSLGLLLGSWLLINTIALRSAALGPVNAFFVLGGSIRREIYVTELAKQHPETPILISQGSQDPCIWLIFQRSEAPIRQVWLEKCADSTFDNFYFNIPLLRQWQVHKVKLITSETHLPRAKWMAQILLGAHGIWVEPDIVKEEGVPGNRESWLKTSLDVARSIVWAIVSQVHTPKCADVIPLSDVNIQEWQQQGFKCEYQGKVQ